MKVKSILSSQFPIRVYPVVVTILFPPRDQEKEPSGKHQEQKGKETCVGENNLSKFVV